MADAVLALEGADRRLRRAAVIRELDLEVGAGEVVALLGANGAGKTTTLRAVSGLIKPMAGRVVFAGDDVARTSPSARARLGIAHVPEGRGLFFGLTVAEHFRVGPSAARRSTSTSPTSTSRSCASCSGAGWACSRAASSRCSRSRGRSPGSRSSCSSTSSASGSPR